MSEENPFADLGQSVASGDGAGAEAADASAPDEGEDDDSQDPLSTPAFEAGNHLNHSVYVRDETWRAFEDTYDIELVPTLRQAGVDSLSKREFHDAALRLAQEEPERLAALLLDARGLDPDDVVPE
jgi:hypothetical protein